MSLADVSERLYARFDGRLSLSTIARVVRGCRRELDITQGPMLHEILERLAHQRLTYLAEQAAGAQHTAGAAPGDPADSGTDTGQ